MLINKSKDMTPFDMTQKPKKQLPILLPLIWGGSFLLTRKFHLKIEKIGMKKIHPPYLVLATHQGFADYYIAPLALFPHRAIYVSDVEGFAAFGKNLYRNIGCIAKRRYVSDINVMRNIKWAVSKGQSVVIYPESRHSNIGTTSMIPDNMGKLAKYLNIPLVILSVHGAYLANPFWNEEKTRKVPIKARLECVCNMDELTKSTADEIQKIISEKLTYDEYDYQHKAGFTISDKDRAEGIEKALYHCINCFEKYHMSSKGSILNCGCCGKKWELTENGWLLTDDNNKVHIPDWYEWQRKQILPELNNNPVSKTFAVNIEALPNEKGFVSLGKGQLTLDQNSFVLSYVNASGQEQTLSFPHKIRESVQTEYNYRNKGACIVLSSTDCCYYLYSDDPHFNPTELQFIGEYLYRKERIVHI